MDKRKRRKEKILLTGVTGSGKTTLFSTLPGKKFAYLFDPNAINTLAGTDVQYIEFLPDMLDINVISLKKGKRDAVVKARTPTIYTEWEADFEERISSGWFAENKIDWIMLDSLTTFSDLIMDRVLWLNGRPGKHPEYDDWTAQMNTIKNVVRTATALGVGFVATAHVEYTQDKNSKILQNVIVLTGQLRTKLPLLFSEIYYCDCQSDMEKEAFTIQTRPDRRTPLIRCTIKGLDMWEDVTVDPKKPRDRQGLGRILRKGGIISS